MQDRAELQHSATDLRIQGRGGLKLRGGERAESARLGSRFGLGQADGVTRVRSRPSRPVVAGLVFILLWFIGVVSVVLLVGIALAALTSPRPGRFIPAITVFAVLMVMAVAGLQLWRLFGALQRWYWYPGGVVGSCRGADPRVLRWDDVESVTCRFSDRHIELEESGTTKRIRVGLSRCILSGKDGTLIDIEPSGRAAYCRLVAHDAACEIEKALWPRIGEGRMIRCYESGEPVVVGQWRIDRAGITDTSAPEKRTVAWAEVGLIRVTREFSRWPEAPRHVELADQAGRTARLAMSLSGVRNGMFLPRFLAHAGSAHNVAVREDVVAPGLLFSSDL